jgi:hypothetical protein
MTLEALMRLLAAVLVLLPLPVFAAIGAATGVGLVVMHRFGEAEKKKVQ